MAYRTSWDYVRSWLTYGTWKARSSWNHRLTGHASHPASAPLQSPSDIILEVHFRRRVFLRSVLMISLSFYHIPARLNILHPALPMKTLGLLAPLRSHGQLVPPGEGANPVTVWEPARHLQSERVLWCSAAALLGTGEGGALESNPQLSWGRQLSVAAAWAGRGSSGGTGLPDSQLARQPHASASFNCSPALFMTR